MFRRRESPLDPLVRGLALILRRAGSRLAL